MVIGFHGKIGSGKSLIASICKELLEESGLKVRVKSFAQPIYDVISELYEMDVDEIKTHIIDDKMCVNFKVMGFRKNIKCYFMKK